jgi:hypothetical protein
MFPKANSIALQKTEKSRIASKPHGWPTGERRVVCASLLVLRVRVRPGANARV